MPSRLYNELHQDKEWNFSDLSAKEQAAYREKEKAVNSLNLKREKAEDDWRKGRISNSEYIKVDDQLNKDIYSVIYPQRKEEISKKGGEKKMAKDKVYKPYIYKNPSKRGAAFAKSLKKENSAELTDTQKAFRSGYLLAQKDSATAYKLKKAQQKVNAKQKV